MRLMLYILVVLQVGSTTLKLKGLMNEKKRKKRNSHLQNQPDFNPSCTLKVSLSAPAPNPAAKTKEEIEITFKVLTN